MTAAERAAEAAIDAMIRDFGFEVTHESKRDALDFREVHVAGLRRVLERAYEMGLMAGAAERS